MKKLSIIALALASLTCFAACAQQINFDPDYMSISVQYFPG